MNNPLQPGATGREEGDGRATGAVRAHSRTHCPACNSTRIVRSEVIFELDGADAISPLYAQVRTRKLGPKAAPPGQINIRELRETHLTHAVSDGVMAIVAGVIIACLRWYWLLPLPLAAGAFISVRNWRIARRELHDARAWNERYDETFIQWKESCLCMDCNHRFLPPNAGVARLTDAA